MRISIVILLAVMLMAAAGVAQIDPMLGSHNVNSAGCLSCHAPHAALPGKGAYLWGGSIPTSTYTTYITSDGNGGTLNAGTMTAGLTNAMSTAVANLPMAHTVLCLSCHDTSFNTTMATAIPGSTTKTLNFNIGANENLSGDHPVDIIYPTTNPTYFTVTVNGTNYTVSFTDTLYGYGHPAKLYTDGVNPYIECSSCHNPHDQTATVVPGVGGTLISVCTTHFIRGQYQATNEVATNHAPYPSTCLTPTKTTYTNDNANFCMSCHSYPSNQFTGLVH
ncbi:MAG: hypothetical protein ABSA54_20020 [Terriglobales bacterium]